MDRTHPVEVLDRSIAMVVFEFAVDDGVEGMDLLVQGLDEVSERLETDLVGLAQPDPVEVFERGGAPYLPQEGITPSLPSTAWTCPLRPVRSWVSLAR